MVVQIWMSFGTGFLSFVAGLQGIDRSMYEAGAIDGISNRFQELIYLTLPSMGPQLMFGAVMQISASFSAGAVCMALCGNPSTDYATSTIISHITDYGTVRYEMGYASAMATLLFVVMILTNNLISKILKKYTAC
jgi:multiple sugar transport system permease protein